MRFEGPDGSPPGLGQQDEGQQSCPELKLSIDDILAGHGDPDKAGQESAEKMKRKPTSSYSNLSHFVIAIVAWWRNGACMHMYACGRDVCRC